MAFVKCTGCGKQISDKAPQCPHCQATRSQSRSDHGAVLRTASLLEKHDDKANNAQRQDIRPPSDQEELNLLVTELAPDAPPPKEKKCQFCAETVRYEALKCRHCGSFLGHVAGTARGTEQKSAHDNASDLAPLQGTSTRKRIVWLLIGVLACATLGVGAILILRADLPPEKIFKKNKNAVVFITTYDLLDKPSGQGSGFILGAEGAVATNYHVIKNAARIEIKTVDDRLLQSVGVITIDEGNDLAVVKIKAKGDAPLLQVERGDPNQLQVGEKIYAIGNPKGLECTFSEGVVSGIREKDNNVRLLQISAPISPGSSGGPIINRKGKVVGIATFIIRESQNLNFAFPIDVVRRNLDTSKIIYSFPNTKADWKVLASESNEVPWSNEVGYVNKSEKASIHFDPHSILALEDNCVGVWARLERAASVEYGILGRHDSHSVAQLMYAYLEIDCPRNSYRTKVIFYTDSANNNASVADFSGNNAWERIGDADIYFKLARLACDKRE